MKRILIFSLAYEPFWGGAELAVRHITDRLDPAQYSFDMVTLRFDEKLPEVEMVGNVTVHRIGFTAENVKVSDRALPFACRVAKMLFPITGYLKARALHREHRYDTIWALMANQAGFAALFFKWTYPDVPYLLELQDGNSLRRVRSRRPITMLLWPLYKAIYRRADVVKVISNFIKKLAIEAGYSGRVEVIPNGVDVARFSAELSPEELAEIKQKLGKRMGDVFLFTASRLVLSRGVEDIIRALCMLPANVKLVVVGDGEDRSKLERIAKDAGVRDRVNFVGHINHVALPKYFKAADIFVRPSIIEGMGSAFIEAFAAGIPVVATPVGGIPDFLSDPDRSPNDEPTGLFCNPRDPESIARAVTRYMSDSALAARVVRNAKELASERYDWNTIAENMRKRVFEPFFKRSV